jgi:hypothetical protein
MDLMSNADTMISLYEPRIPARSQVSVGPARIDQAGKNIRLNGIKTLLHLEQTLECK